MPLTTNNLDIYREDQKFIRSRKSNKSEKYPIMTKDKKSHKKSAQEKINANHSKANSSRSKTNVNIVNNYDSLEYSVPEPKSTVKPAAKHNPKRLHKVNSKENLLACLEDIEYAEEDVDRDIESINCDNVSGCLEYEPKKDGRLTLEEYENKKKQQHLLWLEYKKYGISDKVFYMTLECDKISEEISYETDPEYIQELQAKLIKHYDILDGWAKEEEKKMDEWFCNFSENNSELVQKIQRRNNKLGLTVITAFLD